MGPGDSSTTGSALADLVLVSALALATVGAMLLSLSSPVRLVLAVLTVFLPGYVLIAMLFPRRRLAADESPGTLAERAKQLDAFDRLALSVATGLVVTPLFGIALDFTSVSLREGPVVVAIAGFVVVTAALAAVRRLRVPPAQRYEPGTRWVQTVRDTDLQSRHSLVTGLVVVAVLVAAGGVFAVASSDQEGERFTEFSVTGTENGSSTAASYPDSITTGSEISVVLGIGNHERTQQTYTVVTSLQDVTRVDNRTVIQRRESLGVTEITVRANETARFTHSVQPTMVGENLRLTFLLYRGDPAADPRPANAYRWTHLWVNVTQPTAGTP